MTKKNIHVTNEIDATFAILAPQAAASIEAPVEMFTVFAPSPPVPTMSTASTKPFTSKLHLIIALASPTICLTAKIHKSFLSFLLSRTYCLSGFLLDKQLH